MFFCAHTSIGQSGKTHIHQLSADTGYHVEDWLRVMADRDGERKSQGNLCYQHDLMKLYKINSNKKSFLHKKNV